MKGLKNKIGGIIGVFSCFVLAINIIRKLNIIPGCEYATEESLMYKPFNLLFPLDETLKQNRVELSIGIICQPDVKFIDKVKDSLSSIIRQVPDKKQVLIMIAIDTDTLETIPEQIKNVKESFKSFQKTYDVQIGFVTVPKDALKQRLNSPDVDSVLQFYHKSYVTRRTFQNILFSLLFWYSSQYSSSFLLMDADLVMKENSWDILSEQINKNAHRKNISRIFMSESSRFGTLYPTNHLKRLAEFCYWTSPNENIDNLQIHYKFFMQSLKAEKNSEKIFIKSEKKSDSEKLDNPAALISTNMKVYDEIYFPTNPYERGELFWSSTSLPNSTLTLKFLEPFHIKRIVVLTGKDIYFQDDITRAVLEESTNLAETSCSNFKKLSDFRLGKIDMTLPQGRIPSSCLRIRLVENENHWIAIRLIKIYKY